jgi:hypothetical protein
MGETLKAKLEKNGMYEYIRFFLGGPDGEVPNEIVYHHPIGITNIKGDEWVASAPADVTLLLSRERDPNGKDLLIKRIAHKKQAAEVKNLIRTSVDGVVLYPSGEDRNKFLKPHRDAVKKLVKDRQKAIQDWKSGNGIYRPTTSPQKLNEKEELLKILSSLTDQAAKEEIALAEFFSSKEAIDGANQAFPGGYETKKGPYADISQEPLPWAKGLTKEGLQQEIAKYIAILGGRAPGDLGPAITGFITITKK